MYGWLAYPRYLRTTCIDPCSLKNFLRAPIVGYDRPASAPIRAS